MTTAFVMDAAYTLIDLMRVVAWPVALVLAVALFTSRRAR